MRGRPPKPTALKKLAGNPGKRKLNDQEPLLPAGVPAAPEHLSAEAKTEFARVAGQLAAANVVTEADRAILSLYAQAWSRLVEAECEIVKSGVIIKSPSGYPIQNPWLAVANKSAEQVNRYGQQLGLTPSSRTRVKVTPPPPKDPLEEFLAPPAIAGRIGA
jgi:P27 family predicted phage terminase small subunit